MAQNPYAAASDIPLIKSPSLRLPRPVQLPPDIHPLPESVTDYFVYPFTLEPHVITLESSRRGTIAAHAARREAYLRSREDEKERRKREALRRIAPGFEPYGSVLVPTTRHSPASSYSNNNNQNPGMGSSRPTSQHEAQQPPRDPLMDALVNHLAALDSDLTGARPSQPPPHHPAPTTSRGDVIVP